MWHLHIVELLNLKLDTDYYTQEGHLGLTLSHNEGYVEITFDLFLAKSKWNELYWLNIICDKYQ